MTSITLPFLAGILSILSPCVLPLLPIVLGAAAAEHRLGPAALALGVAFCFTATGLFFATVGLYLGFDGAWFRVLSGVLLLVFGVALASTRASEMLATTLSPITRTFGNASNQRVVKGLWGQFGLGVLLGAAWSPCVGPTLGAASLLAAKGENLGSAALTMTIFGIGAALPLLVLGVVSREATLAWRGHLTKAGSYGKVALGVCMIAVAFLVITGWDKVLETELVEMSPAWLTEITTRY